jgi:hypothetical protein
MLCNQERSGVQRSSRTPLTFFGQLLQSGTLETDSLEGFVDLAQPWSALGGHQGLLLLMRIRDGDLKRGDKGSFSRHFFFRCVWLV